MFRFAVLRLGDNLSFGLFLLIPAKPRTGNTVSKVTYTVSMGTFNCLTLQLQASIEAKPELKSLSYVCDRSPHLYSILPVAYFRFTMLVQVVLYVLKLL